MALWGAFRDALAERHRVLAYDHRGTGRSSPAPLWVTTQELARDALGLLDHLRVPRAHVFGISLGGMAATWLDVLAPYRVIKLCLASAPARGLSLTHAGLRRDLQLAACFALPEADVEPRLVDRILSDRFRRDHPDEVGRIEGLVRAEPSTRTDLIKHGLAGVLHDARRVLGRIHAPTLVLAGENDTLLGTEPPRELAAAITGATFEIVRDSGHDITLEQPLATATRVAAFFD